jgi:hypothetical protein
MKLVIFFAVMAMIAAGVERLLARIARNDDAVHGDGWDGVPPGIDDAGC